MPPESTAPTEPTLSTLQSEAGPTVLQGTTSLQSTVAQKSFYVSSLPQLVTMQQAVERIQAEKEAAEARELKKKVKTPPPKTEPPPPKPPEKFMAPPEEAPEEPSLVSVHTVREQSVRDETPVAHIAPRPFKDDGSGKEKTHWFASSVTGLGRMKRLAATPRERAIQANAEPPQNLPAYAPQAAETQAGRAAPQTAAYLAPQPAQQNRSSAPVSLPRDAQAPSLLSADRVSAAAVLAASRQPLPRVAPEAPSFVPLSAQTDYAGTSGEELHTYRSDAQSAIRSQNVTLSQIASAENARAAKAGTEAPRKSGAHILETIGGVVLILAACVLIVFIFVRPALEKHLSSLPESQSFLYVDTTKQVELSEPTRTTLLSDFKKTAGDELSIGLVSRFELFAPASATSTILTELSAQQFLSLIAPHAPDTLSISLQPQYVTGVYSYDGNQPFVVFKVDPAAYDEVFSAMLQWEPDMMSDLSPLFGIAPAAATAQGTSTAAASTTQVARPSAPSFMDATLDNYSVRAIPNAHGQIVLLWGFLNRSTLLIATSQETLQKVVSILTEAPTATEPAE